MRFIKRNKRSNVNEALGNRISVRSLRHFGFRAHKISDVMGTSFTDKKPYDIFGCSPVGTSIAIEGKLQKKYGKFNWKVFESQQLVELDLHCLKCKGRSFVFLYLFIGAKKELCILDWKKYHKQIKTDKGITIDQLRNKEVGEWYRITKDDFGKEIFRIKGFMK